MALTAAEVADLLTQEGSRAQQDETLDSAEAIQRRVQLLAPVLDTCQQAWQSGSLDIDLLAEKLGDGSRDGKSNSIALSPSLDDNRDRDFYMSNKQS